MKNSAKLMPLFADNKKSLLNFYAKHPRPVLIGVVVLGVLLGKALFFSKGDEETERSKKNKQTPVVEVAKVAKQDIPVYLTALGSITPQRSVVIKTQINGQLLKILFQQGQMVKKGDLLVQIDPRPYEAQLKQFEGQLQKDQALLKNAKIDLERYEKLIGEGAVSPQTLATQKSLVEQYEGTVKSDQGQVDAAKLNREYCDIKSPIDGKIGILQVDPGNYVQLSDPNGIVIVNTVDPIFATFSIPQDSLQKVLKCTADGNKLRVDALDREQNKELGSGELASIDNQIDVTTGSVKLRATFKNPDNHLFPNQFVNVRMLVETLHNSKVVPTAAVQHSPKGTFVYKLRKKEKVVMVPVEVKTVNGEDSAITGDINFGDFVVSEGTDKLFDGVTVKITDNKPKPDDPDKDHKNQKKSAP